MEEYISQIAVTLEGSGLRARLGRTRVQSLSPVANFCPRLFPSSQVGSWRLLRIFCPLLGNLSFPQPFAERELLFYSRLLPLLKANPSGEGSPGHAPGSLDFLSIHHPKERGWVVSSFLQFSLSLTLSLPPPLPPHLSKIFVCLFVCSCGTWSQFLKPVPKLPTCFSDSYEYISPFGLWTGSGETLLTNT